MFIVFFILLSLTGAEIQIAKGRLAPFKILSEGAPQDRFGV